MGTKVKQVTGAERISYMLYFLGQNTFYMLNYMYLNAYFTDVGIPTAAVAVVVLIVKIWDAINDPIFGGIVDKAHFKSGKFVPWLRICIPVILIANVLLFAIPLEVSNGVKIGWAIIAYALWSVGYTMTDVPIFGLITCITDDQDEKTSLNASGRITALVATLAVAVIIPVFRNAIGGWTMTVLALSCLGAVFMIPIGVTAKERVKHQQSEESGDASMKEIFSYLKSNKYLFIFYIAFLISGSLNVGASWGLYIARYCVGNESIMSITSMFGILPAIFVGMFVPVLCRKFDKFKVFYVSVILMAVVNILGWIVGYQSIPAYLAMSFLISVPTGLYSVLTYMFTPDCAEYGQYVSGVSKPGITFAIQTFFAKLQSALVASLSALVLGMTGFVEGENAVQPDGFAGTLWNTSKILPIAGYVLALVILHFYKLNDHDVALMTKVNKGELTKAEAEKQMVNKY